MTKRRDCERVALIRKFKEKRGASEAWKKRETVLWKGRTKQRKIRWKWGKN